MSVCLLALTHTVCTKLANIFYSTSLCNANSLIIGKVLSEKQQTSPREFVQTCTLLHMYGFGRNLFSILNTFQTLLGHSNRIVLTHISNLVQSYADGF